MGLATARSSSCDGSPPVDTTHTRSWERRATGGTCVPTRRSPSTGSSLPRGPTFRAHSTAADLICNAQVTARVRYTDDMTAISRRRDVTEHTDELDDLDELMSTAQLGRSAAVAINHGLFQQCDLTHCSPHQRSRLTCGSNPAGSGRVKFASGRGFRVVPERPRTVYEVPGDIEMAGVSFRAVSTGESGVESGHLLLCDLVQWSGVSGVARARRRGSRLSPVLVTETFLRHCKITSEGGL